MTTMTDETRLATATMMMMLTDGDDDDAETTSTRTTASHDDDDYWSQGGSRSRSRLLGSLPLSTGKSPTKKQPALCDRQGQVSSLQTALRDASCAQEA